ncbi:hypothetical protein LTR37_002823 [Vermiconidia calcicola]|uniref:Uncharacterized protein n=1 Tax=Vermiconidia calcicola TaxID=1690605 RepID=A0ACC3NRT8_9PEZI|nr:hypothetical protein LTR37_002823 [Vermiconidia calcicola]
MSSKETSAGKSGTESASGPSPPSAAGSSGDTTRQSIQAPGSRFEEYNTVESHEAEAERYKQQLEKAKKARLAEEAATKDGGEGVEEGSSTKASEKSAERSSGGENK